MNASRKYWVEKLVTFDKGWLTTRPFVQEDPKGEVGPTPSARSGLSCNSYNDLQHNSGSRSSTMWDAYRTGVVICKQKL